MNPRQTAVHWIEHVLEFGGKHLRSHALDLPWYQYLMLDIAALLLVVVSLVMTVIVLVGPGPQAPCLYKIHMFSGTNPITAKIYFRLSVGNYHVVIM